MSRKGEKFRAAIQYPALTYNFEVDTGNLTKTLKVESTTLPLNAVEGYQIWYKGQSISFPSESQTGQEWTCSVYEAGDFSVINSILTAMTKLGSKSSDRAGYPGNHKAWLKMDTITVRIGTVFAVNLSGAYLKQVRPITLNSSDPTTPLKWELVFRYDRSDVVAAIEEGFMMYGTQKVSMRNNPHSLSDIVNIGYEQPDGEVTAQNTKAVVAQNTTSAIMKLVNKINTSIQKEEAKEWESANSKNLLSELAELTKAAADYVDSKQRMVNRQIRKVEKVISAARNIKNEVENIVEQPKKIEKQWKNMTNTVKNVRLDDIDSILNAGSAVTRFARQSTSQASSFAHSVDNITQSANGAVNKNGKRRKK